MKQILLLLLVVAFEPLSAATLSGTVLDGETNDYVLFATVAIYDNGKLWRGVDAGLEGDFKIKNLPNKRLTIEISYLGYTTLVDEIDFTKKDEHHQIFKLSNEGILIACFEIVAKKEPYERCCICCGTVNHISENQDSILFEKTPISSYVEPSLDIVLFPNPTSDFIIINNQKKKYDNIKILDIKGRIKTTILLKSSIQTHIDLKDYFPGSYIVQMYKGNKLINTEKLIVIK